MGHVALLDSKNMCVCCGNLEYPRLSNETQIGKVLFQIFVTAILDLSLIGLFPVLVLDCVNIFQPRNDTRKRRKALSIEMLVVLQIDKELRRPRIRTRRGVRDGSSFVGVLYRIILEDNSFPNLLDGGIATDPELGDKVRHNAKESHVIIKVSRQ
jgi:hypothetical protein